MSVDAGDGTGAGTGATGCFRARDLLPLHFYGLVDAPERESLERHLLACPGCAAAWSETRAILGSVDAASAFPREREVDWPGLARRTALRAHLAERHDASPAQTADGADAARPLPFRPPFRPALAWSSLAALAALLMVLVGVRALRAPAARGTGPVVRVPDASSSESARFLQQGLARQGAARYLRDSRALLVDLLHAPVRCRRADGSLDVALEKEHSQELLRRKNLYLDALGGPADQRLADLVRQLETLLVQVSTLDDCAAARQIRDLREEIERRQILLRIDLVASEVEGGSSRA